MFKHILIPTDSFKLSEEAIHAGVEMARANGARVTGLFAAQAPTPLVYDDFVPVGYLPPDEHRALIEKTSKHHLAVIENAAHKAGVEVNCISVTSEFPTDTIVEAARKEHCDLIFIASHGRRRLSGILPGSETQKVLTHSKVPVLVYR
jgi:nucleotide-binding universal stress UspA family protein